MRRILGPWLAVGWAGFALLPWNAIGGGGFFSLHWLANYPWEPSTAPALVELVRHGRLWLAPLLVVLVAALLIALRPPHEPSSKRRMSVACIAIGAVGLLWLIAMAAAIDIGGWRWSTLAHLFGELPRRQPGLGYGAVLTASSLVVLLCHGLAMRGFVRGDTFIASLLGACVAMAGVFVAYPLVRLFLSAFVDTAGRFSLSALASRLAASGLWSVVGNTLQLGLMTASAATVLALGFVLIVTRTRSRLRRTLNVLSVLPMITPPFVIGLALILLFGRSGAVNAVLEWAFSVRPTRWIYGLPGVWLAQTLALTPVAYLVLIGVAEGVSPALEEAAQTLRASPMQTLRTITLPLIAPGIANAFLIAFIESLADFGNPLLLGGNLEVLSTAIYFAVVGVQQDPGRASVLAVILLALSVALFVLQRRLLGRRSFVTIGGKGEGGARTPLPKPAAAVATALVVPWAGLAVVIYAMIFTGGFFEKWGLNHALTLRHYATAFGVALDNGTIFWSGGAWSSFATTLTIALVSAPLTAAFGLAVAYLLDRQRFAGKRLFEFATMLNFAVPGTVVGIAYVLAFNAPPIDLAYTGLILVACFVFRDMTAGLRAGLASLAQIDPSLDDASATLRAPSFTTLRRVVLPLIRPAVVAALVYSFISAMTSISAVIFLTSPRFDMATVNIVGRAEVGEYGYATAYASVLIVLMVLAVVVIRVLVGKRQVLRRPVFDAAMR
jgi:iron(III) transport system permease protein